jgi:DNA-binding MarR family transcriptional regulator
LRTKSRRTIDNDPLMGDSILTRARLLSKAVTGIYDEQLRPFGISSTQFALLAVISKTEPVTRTGIARVQHLDKSTLTRNLRTILSERWAEEVRENANGRSRPLALTAVGKELLQKAGPAWLAAQAQAVALLGDDGTIAVVSATDRIVTLMATLVG